MTTPPILAHIPRVDTVYQCKLSLILNPNTVFFFYNSDLVPDYYFAEETKLLVYHAAADNGYLCVYYDIKQLNFHKDKIPQEVASGVLFYYQAECRAVNTTFDENLFKETMAKLPTLEELSVVQAREKAKADADKKAKAAKKAKEAQHLNDGPNYDFSLCVIL